MPPITVQELRRRLWHVRGEAAAKLAPRGYGAQVEADPEAAGEDSRGDETRRMEATQDLREASEAARAAGERYQAADQLRRLTLLDPQDSSAWFLYAMRLIELKAYDASFEALKNSVAVQPANLDALEMLVDAAAGDSDRQSSVSEAMDALTAVLAERTDQHRRSLDLLVPARRTAALDILSQSPDRVTRAVVGLHRCDAEDPVAQKPSWLAEDEWTLAQLLFCLQRGRRTRAIELMRDLPDRAVPRWSLRLAIRRDLRANRNDGARRLLAEFTRLEPSDTWGRRQSAKLAKSAAPTNYQLAKRGFPFPHRRTESAYEPISDRVLYMLHNSLPYHSAGYSTRTHGLLSGLRGLGWDVQGVTRLGYPYDMPKMAELGEIAPVNVVDGIPYHRLSTTPGIEKKSPITEYVKRYVAALEAKAMEEKPSILHGASNHWNGLATVSTAYRLGIPSIYEVRGLWEVTRGSRDFEWAKGGMYRFMARMEADAAANATHVLAITQALKDELINRGVDGEKITVVPNAVDAQRFTPQPRDAELEAQLGFQGKTVIGYIGSVLDYEGLGLLIEAAERMRSQRNDFVVMIVGDGAELERFQSEVETRELRDVVRFLGRVPHEDVERYYSLVDIAPFPRLPLPVCEMVSPLKPFEALAMGKAIVASDVAALAEIVQPNVTGLLHRKGDVDDLTAKLTELVERPELRAQLSSNGLTWVRENRQWPDMAQRVSAIYESLGAQRTKIR
ncbi:glycosyltransferase [Kocuria palustris]|nr:glycosyltransferase [Kocuria palustris]